MLMTTYRSINQPGRPLGNRQALARRTHLDYFPRAQPGGPVVIGYNLFKAHGRRAHHRGEFSSRQLRYCLPWQMRYPAP